MTTVCIKYLKDVISEVLRISKILFHLPLCLYLLHPQTHPNPSNHGMLQIAAL